MTDISSPSVPASQTSTGEPATPSGPHVASMSITVLQPRGTTGFVRVRSATRSAELCVRDPGDDPCYRGEQEMCRTVRRWELQPRPSSRSTASHWRRTTHLWATLACA